MFVEVQTNPFDRDYLWIQSVDCNDIQLYAASNNIIGCQAFKRVENFLWKVHYHQFC